PECGHAGRPGDPAADRPGAGAAHPRLAGGERPVPRGRGPSGRPRDRREAACRPAGQGAGVKDLRTSLLAVILWAVALVCIQLPALSLPLAGACGTAAVLTVLAWRAGRRGMRLPSNGLVVLILLCCAAVGMSVAAAQPQRAVLAQSDGRAVEVVVTVSSSASVGS